MKARLVGWLIVVAGVAVTAYGLLGIAKYGFYVSGRWSLGQTDGGLAPLFVLVGLVAVAYGIFDLKLKGREPEEQEVQNQTDREK